MNIAGAHDIGAPEENDAVAIGVREGLVNYFNRFAVEKQFLFGSVVGVGGPRLFCGALSLPSCALMRSRML
jgi:hypothetical protein